MLAADIRNNFLSFFKKNGHRVIDSSSVVPQNDPSLLFTNSGMVQFKNIFTGLETKEYKRATTSQKCIRAGGKHNDLDQVGFTARHHTFFEMLGNFSFGDYFKDDAIDFAWNFLTKELEISRDKLSVTVYHTDEQAKKIWKKVAGDINIIPIATSDNFWSMGDTGPCGPCSEIFYDHGDKIFGGLPGTPDETGDRYVEIWNIVFMQYEQKANGERISLKNQSIDTGMGLERITSIMQGVHDNYQTDLFKEIIDDVKSISKTNYESIYPSYKVIADHIRSIAFLIADGVIPSNEGRGYVLRRILRRAMRHGNMIGIKKEPFLFKISNTLINKMKDTYPELKKTQAAINTIISDEEEKFLDTLDRGLKILQTNTSGISTGGVLDGKIAFKLYDTYGFPLDLTQDILKSENVSVDIDGFNESLEEQKSRAQWSGSGESKEDEIWHTLREKLKATEFTGYEKENDDSEIIAIVKDGAEVSSCESGDTIFLITSSTPFYSECGGQCGDTGYIEKSGGVFKVSNTLKFCDAIIAHKGEIVSGKFSVSDKVSLKINSEKRKKIKANHTATHLLHAALKLILGNHVSQRGSFLNDERLRFDFSHNSAISKEDLEKIEAIVNEWILQGLHVIQKTISKNEAISSGATALFGEKYGDFVKTIRICSDASEDNCKVSFELCGGTHVSNTSEIGSLKILSESSIGSGIRRIEAITGLRVLNYLNELEKSIISVSKQLKCTPGEILQKIDDLLSELKKKNQEIILIKQKVAISNINKFEKNDINIISAVIEDYNMEELRTISEIIQSQNPKKTIAIVISNEKDKVNALLKITADLQSKYNAREILNTGLQVINGKGGGGLSFAQGGGTGKSKIPEMIQNILDAL